MGLDVISDFRGSLNYINIYHINNIIQLLNYQNYKYISNRIISLCFTLIYGFICNAYL